MDRSLPPTEDRELTEFVEASQLFDDWLTFAAEVNPTELLSPAIHPDHRHLFHAIVQHSQRIVSDGESTVEKIRRCFDRLAACGAPGDVVQFDLQSEIDAHPNPGCFTSAHECACDVVERIRADLIPVSDEVTDPDGETQEVWRIRADLIPDPSDLDDVETCEDARDVWDAFFGAIPLDRSGLHRLTVRMRRERSAVATRAGHRLHQRELEQHDEPSPVREPNPEPTATASEDATEAADVWSGHKPPAEWRKLMGEAGIGNSETSWKNFKVEFGGEDHPTAGARSVRFKVEKLRRSGIKSQ